MIDKFVTIFTTALVVTGVGIALRPKSSTAAVIKATGNAFAGIETATYGPK